MGGFTIIVLIFGIILFVVLVILYFINQIIEYQNTLDYSFIAVKLCVEKMKVIIDNIDEFIRFNLNHEISLHRNFHILSNEVRTIENNKEGIEKIKNIEKELLRFSELENTYPNLSKNKEFIKFKEEILNTKERLVYAFENYDKGVISYNKYKENKFINLLSKMIKSPEYDSYNK